MEKIIKKTRINILKNGSFLKKLLKNQWFFSKKLWFFVNFLRAFLPHARVLPSSIFSLEKSANHWNIGDILLIFLIFGRFFAWLIIGGRFCFGHLQYLIFPDFSNHVPNFFCTDVCKCHLWFSYVISFWMLTIKSENHLVFNSEALIRHPKVHIIVCIVYKCFLFLFFVIESILVNRYVYKHIHTCTHIVHLLRIKLHISIHERNLLICGVYCLI